MSVLGDWCLKHCADFGPSGFRHKWSRTSKADRLYLHAKNGNLFGEAILWNTTTPKLQCSIWREGSTRKDWLRTAYDPVTKALSYVADPTAADIDSWYLEFCLAHDG